MSRSRRKTPIVGMTMAESEKKDKKIANRRLRAGTRDILKKIGRDINADDIEDINFMDEKESGSPWDMAKDGKQYIGDMDDVEYYKKLMRK